MTPPQFFLGRQPIVGRERELRAYELLFRSSSVNQACVPNDVAASAAVIQHAFSDLGVQSVLGDKQGFINVSEALLMSDVIEALPREQVVLEILETVPLTPEVITRIRKLKFAGYRLALDDVVQFEENYRAVIPLVEVVKLDVLLISPEKLEPLVKKLQLFDARLLAEKIDTPAQKDFCQSLGFDLFQGYYFARPTILSGRPIQPSAMQLLKLLSQVAADVDTIDLEETLKLTPELALHLMKLVNSIGFGASRKISSVRAAITLLGRSQLNRWVQIMVFAQQSSGHSISDPLVQTAAVRGRMMENMVKASKGNVGFGEQAFMVGMLSLMDVLFSQPLADILQPLNLDDAVLDALLHKRGVLGDLLGLAESAENSDEAAAARLIAKLGKLSLDQVNRCQIEALSWANTLGVEE